MTKPQLIKNLIELSGLNQEKFALKHGKGENQVSEWKTGKRIICDKTLTEIAKNEGFKLTIELKLEKL